MTVSRRIDHLGQGRGNRAHAEWLLQTQSNNPIALQWAVTAAFYSALHGMSLYLRQRGVTVTTHTNRTKALGNPANGVPVAILNHYRRLEFKSRGARYGGQRFTQRQVQALLDNELAAVAAFTGL
jgi:hypothetical protein